MTWTDEDEAASHGGEFDPRPAYIVKLPNQQNSARIDQPFSAVSTRALLDALMQDHFKRQPTANLGQPAKITSFAGSSMKPVNRRVHRTDLITYPLHHRG